MKLLLHCNIADYKFPIEIPPNRSKEHKNATLRLP